MNMNDSGALVQTEWAETIWIGRLDVFPYQKANKTKKISVYISDIYGCRYIGQAMSIRLLFGMYNQASFSAGRSSCPIR